MKHVISCLVGVAVGAAVVLTVRKGMEKTTFVKEMIPKARGIVKKASLPSEADIRKAKRAVKEYENFMTYDGTEQEDILV